MILRSMHFDVISEERSSSSSSSRSPTFSSNSDSSLGNEGYRFL